MLEWLLNALGLGAAERPGRARSRTGRGRRALDSAHDDPVEPTIVPGGHDRDVVGEARYATTLRRLMKGAEVHRSGEWQVREVLLELRREPFNKFDPNAIRVLVDGDTVAYVDRDDTAEFNEVLAQLERAGRKAICSGRIVGKEGRFGVKLAVTTPLRVMPKPSAPVIDGDMRVALMGEEDHQLELATVHARSRGRRFVAELVELNGVLWVHVRGDRIGRLSDPIGERYLPAYRDLARNGMPVTCWAELADGELKVEAYVFLANPRNTRD